MGFLGLGDAISGIGSIFNMFDDSAEDAAWQQHMDNEAALNLSKKYMDDGINAINTGKDFRYQNMMDLIKAQQDTNYNAYNDYRNNVPEAQQGIKEEFKGYFTNAQGQLVDQYGNAINTQENALQNALNSLQKNYNTPDFNNALNALKTGYDTGAQTGDNAINPYRDVINNRLNQVSNNPALNYDNNAAYAERERLAQESMNRQLLARGEFNSSEGLRQNQEITKAMNLQNELDDYNRALQLAELERGKTGEITNLVGAGLNTETTGQGLGNYDRQLGQNLSNLYMANNADAQKLGTQQADLYMNQGNNLSNIYTGLGNTQAGATQSMGQDITNLNNTFLGNNTTANQAYYNQIGNLYNNQMGQGQDIYNDWVNSQMSMAIQQPVVSTMQKNAGTDYAATTNANNYNTATRNNAFSNLGTIFNQYQGNKNNSLTPPAQSYT